MWQLLEPQIESVRRRLAAHFGCDPEEMAITRNASESLEICILGLDLKPGDEVLTTNQDYPRMLTTWRQRERRDGIVLRDDLVPRARRRASTTSPTASEARSRRSTRVIHVCHITNLTGPDLPGEGDLPDRPRAGDRGHRGRGPRLRPFPFHSAPTSTATTTGRACTSGSSRPHGTGLPLRAQGRRSRSCGR